MSSSSPPHHNRPIFDHKATPDSHHPERRALTTLQSTPQTIASQNVYSPELSSNNDLSSRFNAVVLFEVSFVDPEYLRPWQKSRQGSCTGTGFAIEGRKIITNTHVVQHATDIRLRKHGNSRRWRAKVVCSGPDVDLAVVEVYAEGDEKEAQEEIEAFWEGISPLQWAPSLPSLQSSVNVVGYPTGGRTICVTEGVISRIDCRNYRIDKTSRATPGGLLVIQIDAAINAGNSGGPCFDGNGNVVGVAFQGLDGGDAQNVGYIIPTNIALNFLYAIDNPRNDYKGVQEMPFRWAPLQNKSLRKLLKMPKESSGVVLTSVSPLAIAAHDEFLQVDDVITHIDGKSLGDDFTVPLRGDELLHADFLITGKREGAVTSFDIIREKEKLQINSTLDHLTANVPREHGIDCVPSWLVVGGLLFVPLTCPLLSYGNEKDLEQSGYMKLYDYIEDQLSEFRTVLGKETILLIDILKCDTNFGYEFAYSWKILETVNGQEVRNMAHLYNIYRNACQSLTIKNEKKDDTKDDYLIFKFKDKMRIVLETAECMSSEEGVLKQNGIPSPVSVNIVEQADLERDDIMRKKDVASDVVPEVEKTNGELAVGGIESENK